MNKSASRRRHTGNNRRRAQFQSHRWIPRLEVLEGRRVLATLTWTGGAGDNNFATAANWEDVAGMPALSAPGPLDDALISLSGSNPVIQIANNTDVSVNSLVTDEDLEFGDRSTFTVATTADINATAMLAGGELIGGEWNVEDGEFAFNNDQDNRLTDVAVTGGIELLESSYVELYGATTFDTATLNSVNGGQPRMRFEPGYIIGGTITAEGSGSGVRRLQVDVMSDQSGTVTIGPTGSIVNNSTSSNGNRTLELGDSGTITGISELINQGSIVANVGRIHIRSDTFVNAGSIDIHPDTVLEMQSGTDFAATSLDGTVTATGSIDIAASGTLIAAGTSATEAFNPGSFTNSGLTVISGALDNSNSALELNSDAGIWRLAGGQIQGGTLNQTGDGRLTFDTNNANRLTDIAVTGGIELVETSYVELYGATTFDTATLNSVNGGQPRMRFEPGYIISGPITAEGSGSGSRRLQVDVVGGQSGTVTIGPTGSIVNNSTSSNGNRTLELGESGTITGNSELINQGSIVANVGRIQIRSDTFVNAGSIDVHPDTVLEMLSGTDFAATSLDGAVTATGSIDIATSGTLITAGTSATEAFNPGSFTNSGLTVISGALDNSNSALELNSNAGIWRLAGGQIQGGTLNQTGDGRLTFDTNNANRLTDIAVTGGIELVETSYVELYGATTFDTATLNSVNGGQPRMRFEPGYIISGPITAEGSGSGIRRLEVDVLGNQSGTVTIGPTGSIVNNSTVNNDPSFRSLELGDAGAFTATGELVNQGSIVANAGRIQVRSDTFLNNVTGEVLASSGDIDFRQAVISSGRIEIRPAATIEVERLDQTGNTVIVDGVLESQMVATFDSVLLSGEGNIDGEVDSIGTTNIAPGRSPGMLSTGSFDLGVDSTLLIETGGTIPGIDYDQVEVTGTVDLFGSLSVEIVSSILKDEEFVIIDNDGTDAVNGVFAGLQEGAIIDNGYDEYLLSYEGGDGNDVTLTALGNVRVVTNTSTANPGSLAGEIEAANGLSDPAAVIFRIPGGTAHTITPGTPLPTITNSVIVDGRTQPGFGGSPPITLEGSGVAGNGFEFATNASGSGAFGFAIQNFGGAGIAVNAGNVTLRENLYSGNAGLAIDFGDDGPTFNDNGDLDLLVNMPEIQFTRAGAQTRLIGSISSTPNTTLEIDVFANVIADLDGFGEGERFLGSFTVNTDGIGDASFDETLAVATTVGEFLSAIATEDVRGTSEFSNAATTLTPEAVDDVFLTDEDTPLNFNALANEVNPQGSIVPGQTLALTDPADGVLVNQNDGSFSFDPAASFQFLAVNEATQVQFDYQIEDVFGVTDSASVTLTIEGVNDDPTVTAVVAESATEDDAMFTVDLLTGAVDVDLSDTLSVDMNSFMLNSGDDLGITIGTNELTVDPTAYNSLAVGESEIVEYSYNIVDGNGGAVSQTAEITIIGVNDSPTIDVAQQTVTVDEGDVAGNFGAFADPDGDLVSLSSSVGVITDIGGGEWTWSYAAADGPDDGQVVVVTATDGNGGIESASFELDVMIDGDFDDDDVYGCSDVNMLTTNIAAGIDNLAFDLNGDDVVDLEDLDAWLVEAGAANNASGGAFIKGDANLDGVVDVSDFNVWNDNKFSMTTNWCSGNFSGDAVVDVSDFNIWNDNKFTTAILINTTFDIAPRDEVAMSVLQPMPISTGWLPQLDSTSEMATNLRPFLSNELAISTPIETSRRAFSTTRTEMSSQPASTSVPFLSHQVFQASHYFERLLSAESKQVFIEWL